MVEIGKLLTEGKGKRVYATGDPDTAVVYFKDEALAFRGLKRARSITRYVPICTAFCPSMA